MHNLEPTSILSLLGLIGFAIAGLYAIGKLTRGVYRFAKRLELIHDTILTELLPNGGNSIKDQIVDLTRRVTNVEDAICPISSPCVSESIDSSQAAIETA